MIINQEQISFKTPLGRFLKIGFVEGVSFLVLLLIAMPLKYIAHMPTPVRVVGMIHGVLFIGYVIALFQAARAYNWPIKTVTVAFLLSFFPFGTFFLDRVLKKQE
jgi:integral membrane protein